MRVERLDFVTIPVALGVAQERHVAHARVLGVADELDAARLELRPGRGHVLILHRRYAPAG